MISWAQGQVTAPQSPWEAQPMHNHFPLQLPPAEQGSLWQGNGLGAWGMAGGVVRWPGS